MEAQTLHLKNWFIDKDPENAGLALGWTSRVSETAVETAVPSIIQQMLFMT